MNDQSKIAKKKNKNEWGHEEVDEILSLLQSNAQANNSMQELEGKPIDIMSTIHVKKILNC